MRQPADVFPRSVEVVAVSDLTRPVEWRALLKGVETVVHLAGIAHAGPEIAEEAYDRVNRLATAELAERRTRRRHPPSRVHLVDPRAERAVIRRRSARNRSRRSPTDAYGRSKLAAEDAVRAAGVPFTILRPVLVYGPGVKGNLDAPDRRSRRRRGRCRSAFAATAARCWRGRISSARSTSSCEQPAAKGETYIVADPMPLTLAEIVAALRAGAGTAARAAAGSAGADRAGGQATGRAEDWQRIGGSHGRRSGQAARQPDGSPPSTRARASRR